MANMLRSNCSRGCCLVDNRAAEVCQWRNWIAEYEDPQHVIDRACPKGGPDCGCDKADL